jgi:lipoate-protein ligase A
MNIAVFPEILPAQAAMARQEAAIATVYSGFAPAALLVWRSQQALVVTRRDSQLPTFDEASRRLHAEGWPVLVRPAGGGAFPIRPGTVQIGVAVRVRSRGQSIDEHYRALFMPIAEALDSLGVRVMLGEVPHAFCGGKHDIISSGRKLGGMAQHWRRVNEETICVFAGASILAHEEPRLLADRVNRFYALAGGDFRCAAESITSLRCEMGGKAPADDIAAALRERLAAAFHNDSRFAA